MLLPVMTALAEMEWRGVGLAPDHLVWEDVQYEHVLAFLKAPTVLEKQNPDATMLYLAEAGLVLAAGTNYSVNSSNEFFFGWESNAWSVVLSCEPRHMLVTSHVALFCLGDWAVVAT